MTTQGYLRCFEMFLLTIVYLIDRAQTIRDHLKGEYSNIHVHITGRTIALKEIIRAHKTDYMNARL